MSKRSQTAMNMLMIASLPIKNKPRIRAH